MRKRNDDIRLECVNWDEEQPATIAFADGAPHVYNPFGDPIHASLEGTVTFGNDAVEGEVAFVPEE